MAHTHDNDQDLDACLTCSGTEAVFSDLRYEIRAESMVEIVAWNPASEPALTLGTDWGVLAGGSHLDRNYWFKFAGH